MQKPVQRTLTVTRILKEGASRRGDPYIEAQTDIGIVAFWGGARSTANIRAIRAATPPFQMTCGCIKPSTAYATHAAWVPETPTIAVSVHDSESGPDTEAAALTRWPQARLLVANFPHWVAQFDQNGPFRKAGQLEWHRKTIDRRRALGSAAAAIADDEFLQSLYATLRARGIGFRESKLVPFEAFAVEIRRHEAEFVALDSLRIDDGGLNVPHVGDRIWKLLDGLRIVENKARLVSGTKAVHHVLPELVVPMDRAYTQAFFRWQNPQFQYSQRDCFNEAFEAFVEIARLVHPVVGTGWRSSRTKIIDNAIVAFVQSTKSAS